MVRIDPTPASRFGLVTVYCAPPTVAPVAIVAVVCRWVESTKLTGELKVILTVSEVTVAPETKFVPYISTAR